MCINTSQSQLTVKFPPPVGNQKEKFTFDASTLLWRNPFCRLPWPGLASLWTLKDGLRIEGWHVQFCLMKFALQFANNCGRTINLDKVLCLLCLRRVGSVDLWTPVWSIVFKYFRLFYAEFAETQNKNCSSRNLHVHVCAERFHPYGYLHRFT